MDSDRRTKADQPPFRVPDQDTGTIAAHGRFATPGWVIAGVGEDPQADRLRGLSPLPCKQQNRVPDPSADRVQRVVTDTGT